MYNIGRREPGSGLARNKLIDRLPLAPQAH